MQADGTRLFGLTVSCVKISRPLVGKCIHLLAKKPKLFSILCSSKSSIADRPRATFLTRATEVCESLSDEKSHVGVMFKVRCFFSHPKIIKFGMKLKLFGRWQQN